MRPRKVAQLDPFPPAQNSIFLSTPEKASFSKGIYKKKYSTSEGYIDILNFCIVSERGKQGGEDVLSLF